jgi:hypothetical protein
LECWRLEQGPREVNSVPGRIGGSVYLGEVARHDFVPSRGRRTARNRTPWWMPGMSWCWRREIKNKTKPLK